MCREMQRLCQLMKVVTPDRWNSKSRLKCCSYYNLIGLSSFMRYTLGITEEGITGGINHGNEEKESVWDEGRVRSSPEQQHRHRAELSACFKSAPSFAWERIRAVCTYRAPRFFPMQHHTTQRGHVYL